MAFLIKNLSTQLERLHLRVDSLRSMVGPSMRSVIEQWDSLAGALQYHLDRPSDRPPVLAVMGGTGTGKSTLVNLLLEADLAATSFRRTYTRGALAIVGQTRGFQKGWLGIEHRELQRDELPSAGEAGVLLIASKYSNLLDRLILVDTPDLDGDVPEHLVEAERVFRWSNAVLFLVTPEKYQMSELRPYYRLARRYGLPALFVMNKCWRSETVEDFRKQLDMGDWPQAKVYGINRDDSMTDIPSELGIEALRDAVQSLQIDMPADNDLGVSYRCIDLLGRLRDMVLDPLRAERGAIESARSTLKALDAHTEGVDVSPMTRQLQNRLQQQSILYLMGPRRMIERFRQVPAFLANMPRSAWDLFAGGRKSPADEPASTTVQDHHLPDFEGALKDQFLVLQTRIEDILRINPMTAGLVEAEGEAFTSVWIGVDQAAGIARDELDELQTWLERRHGSKPRDTRMVEKMLKNLPGGRKLVKWSELSPYLLTVIVATHQVFFGPVDLIVLGGFSLATWVGEKLSNEVTARTNLANRRIGERFTLLARRQIEIVIRWLDRQAPAPVELDEIESLMEEIAEEISE